MNRDKICHGKKEGEVCTESSCSEGEDCCATKPTVSSCCSGNTCNTKPELPSPEEEDCCAAKPEVSSCCSENTCNTKPELPSPEGEDCCAAKPEVSACCSENTCNTKPELPSPEGEDCCAAKPEVSSCCSGNTCNTKPELPSPEGEDCCAAKPEVSACCSGEPNISTPDIPLLSEPLCESPAAPDVIVDLASVVEGKAPESPLSESEDKQPAVFSTTKLRVQNICCALEGKLVEEALKPLDGVASISVNVIGRIAFIRHDPELTSAADLLNVLNGIHLGASIMESGAHSDSDQDTGLPRSLKLFAVYLVVQTVLMLIAATAFFLKAPWLKWLAIAEIVLGIAPILWKSIASVKKCTLDIHILMLIAVVGTLAIREWIEGAIVVYVVSVADALQRFCFHKVQQTISGLMLKAPQMAVLVDSGECVGVEEVAIGTMIAIRPGELIPLDGVVVKGRAAVDESSISGESVPVQKTVDSEVYSGTVNQNGYLEVKTTSDASTSTVSKVAEMVQEAQASSTQTEIIINRFAKYYTPVVVGAAVLVILVPAILGASGLGTYLQDISEWGERALFLLVTACPCALVMATPIAVVCGITAAARNGALVKGAAHFETLAQLQTLAFDKTGTLTEGKFQVTDIDCVSGVKEREVLRLTAAVESKTSHPLAAAIVNEYSGCVAEMVKSQNVSLPSVSSFQMHEGRGISGRVEGKLIQIGNREFLHHVGGILQRRMEDRYLFLSRESKTVVFVCVNGNLAMMVSLADSIRPNSIQALELLREIGIQTAMITGDNSQTAMAVRNKLGLDECVPEMKPHDKLDWIKRNQDVEPCSSNEIRDQSRRRPTKLCCSSSSPDHGKKIVGMVGDGVNDGPALAAANVGIAMGAGGTALAVEAADVALMSNNLTKIPELVLLGRFCQRVVRQNIVFAVLLKLIIVAVALAGKAALWMAVLADVFGLACVIINGLRPLWWKAKTRERKKEETGNARVYYSFETYV